MDKSQFGLKQILYHPTQRNAQTSPAALYTRPLRTHPNGAVFAGFDYGASAWEKQICF